MEVPLIAKAILVIIGIIIVERFMNKNKKNSNSTGGSYSYG